MKRKEQRERDPPKIRPLLSNQILPTIKDRQTATYSIHDSDTIRKSEIADEREMADVFYEFF